MKVLIIGFCLVLTGCDIQTYELHQWEEFCKDKGGIHHIHPDAWSYVATCNNGAYHHY